MFTLCSASRMATPPLPLSSFSANGRGTRAAVCRANPRNQRRRPSIDMPQSDRIGRKGAGRAVNSTAPELSRRTVSDVSGSPANRRLASLCKPVRNGTARATGRFGNRLPGQCQMCQVPPQIAANPRLKSRFRRDPRGRLRPGARSRHCRWPPWSASCRRTAARRR